MAARAAARGSPATAGVGWSSPARATAVGGGVRSRPATVVARWATVARRATSGWALAETSSHTDWSALRTASTTTLCSRPSFDDERILAIRRLSSAMVSPRPTVPAMGRDTTSVSRRRTSSSGLAPTKPPAANVKHDGWAARSRSTIVARSKSRSASTVICRASTTLDSVPDSIRARASSTAAVQWARWPWPSTTNRVGSPASATATATATAAARSGARPVAGPVVVIHAWPWRVQPTTTAGTISSALSVVGEAQGPDRDRARAGEPQRVVVGDPAQQPCHLGRRLVQATGAPAYPDPGGDARRGQPGAVVQPGEAVGPNRGDQVGGPIQRDGAAGQGDRRLAEGAHVRVPVNSWAMPVDSGRRAASANPTAIIMASRSAVGGR